MKTVRRCQKCKRLPIALVEIWNGRELCFDVDEYGNLSEGYEGHPGDPDRVEAICKCGHHWKLRGVIQIGTEVESKKAF